MARGDILGYKTNKGHTPCVVTAQYDSAGTETDTAAGVYPTNGTVDVILFGWAAGKREGLTVAANEGAASTGNVYTYPIS